MEPSEEQRHIGSMVTDIERFLRVSGARSFEFYSAAGVPPQVAAAVVEHYWGLGYKVGVEREGQRVRFTFASP